MLNPNYFGEVAQHRKSKHTNFIVVGNINQMTKNFKELIRVSKRLHLRKYDFTVTIVGEGEISIPASLNKHIYKTGKVDYPTMYKLLSKADFFIPLLDSKIEEHKRYITQTTTGSLLLILGFAKIPIIEDVFSRFYGFNSTNSISYKYGSLYDGMVRAIQISRNKYETLQINLKKYTFNLRLLSQENLTEQLNKYKLKSQFNVKLEDFIQMFLCKFDYTSQKITLIARILFARISRKFSFKNG